MLNDFISPIEIHFLIALVLSLIGGMVLGYERKSRGKDAGMSTYAFVVMGAMIFTFLSTIVDPFSKSRIAAQIVTGIGFLGAGLILKEGSSIRNLTTAASIWFAGAIGMAFGFGYYFIGITATITGVFLPKISRFTKLISRP